MTDRDLVFQATIDLDVRDAPAREIHIETSADWIVAHVKGKSLADYDVREQGERRMILLHFREGVIGRSLI